MRTLLALSLLVLPLAGEEQASPEKQLASMTWLAGNWSGDMWGGKFHAYYSTPDGGKVLSYSKLLSGGQMRFYEFELFQVSGGAVVLTPHPGGKRAASFKLTALEKGKATFENPKNDFPQKLVYWRKADDNLVITLTGGAKKEVFDLKRS